MNEYVSNYWMNTFPFFIVMITKKGKRERERERENNEPEENLVYVTVLMIIITGLNENHIYPHIGKII